MLREKSEASDKIQGKRSKREILLLFTKFLRRKESGKDVIHVYIRETNEKNAASLLLYTHTWESVAVSKEVIGMSQYGRIHIWKEAIPGLIVLGIAFTEK